ncbi:MAG: PhzF family phenazine biosynthesis protein [Deltaproteobacteria bacterium]|nr:PhzF family phenazine biosynthesis protein [Deltaproteobacteria bacterium]MDQ3295316.1 PhzF family phenazine biosynthesis protein [Myxococcota bacterium]
MTHAFRIVNVFTVDGNRFSGNPLCVFEDARGLEDEQMQALARQMNLSETTFVLPSERADARVRIFTPGFEMPFAGHPTLGTASVIAAAGQDEVKLEMIAGIVQVEREDDGWSLKRPQRPKTRKVEATRIEIAQMLGLPDDALSDEPLWVSTGVEQLVIPIKSSELVRAAKPVKKLLERWAFSDDRKEAMAYLWSNDSSEWTVRFFFTSHGAVIEDAATGSACANLGGWWIARGRQRPLEVMLRQGEAVGRPSRLGLQIGDDDAIYVTGAVIELGRGTVEV